MMRGKIKGFTIIEILLFIAISGALMAVVVSSIGGRQQRVQFTDAMRDLQAFVETQLSYTQTGVNEITGLCSSAVGDGTSKVCINLGRAIVFDTSPNQTTTSYMVIGDRLSAGDEQVCASNNLNNLVCAKPRIGSTSGTTYDTLWGAQFVEGRFKSGATRTRSLAFLRDPRASSIVPMAYDNNPTQPTPIDVINAQATYSTGSTSQRSETVDAYYCFKSADGKMKATLTIVGTQIDMIFEPSAPYNCP